MRITVFGAAGQVGRAVVEEAVSRGHIVTAVVRNPAHLNDLPANALARTGDALKIGDVLMISADQDVVINATRSATSDIDEVTRTTRTLMDGLAQTGVRLLVVGGAASLLVPGTDKRTVLDTPEFLPPSLKQVGLASIAQFNTCMAETRVDWAYLSPPARLTPGKRTGQYRLGRDELLLDEDGDSRITIDDLAVALLDEAENPRHHRARFTAAY